MTKPCDRSLVLLHLLKMQMFFSQFNNILWRCSRWSSNITKVYALTSSYFAVLPWKFYRIRKGKACAKDHSESSVIYFRPIPEENMSRPIIRPLRIQPSNSDSRPRKTSRQSSDPGIKQHPPAHLSPQLNKNMEGDKFLDNKRMDGSDLAGHIRDLSLHSRNASSSGSCSTDCSERDVFGFRDWWQIGTSVERPSASTF